MARIYLSSTYSDLQPYRKAVYEQLRRMKHDVTAMEDYVARDDRPADASVRDVAASELYVGIFAWRYGYIPKNKNRGSLSVTELEYRAALRKKVPVLVFLLDEAVGWPPKWFDSHTREGKAGVRILALRKRLAEERLASFFTTPEDLAAKVGAAVSLAGTVTDATDAASLDLAGIVGDDAIDRPEILFSQSYLPHLIERFKGLGSSPLLKIDLRDGRYWWSTRLYGLATLAEAYTSVDWLLFLNRGKEYVGMVRPGDLRQALALAQPELDEHYRRASLSVESSKMPSRKRTEQVLGALIQEFAQRPGGERALRFLVDSKWITEKVRSISTVHVEHSGPFDPLATYQLLQADTPFVPITKGQQLVKVIDRVGVATAVALTAVERRLGRK